MFEEMRLQTVRGDGLIAWTGKSPKDPRGVRLTAASDGNPWRNPDRIGLRQRVSEPGPHTKLSRRGKDAPPPRASVSATGRADAHQKPALSHPIAAIHLRRYERSHARFALRACDSHGGPSGTPPARSHATVRHAGMRVASER
jgi:hypothetical protein